MTYFFSFNMLFLKSSLFMWAIIIFSFSLLCSVDMLPFIYPFSDDWSSQIFLFVFFPFFKKKLREQCFYEHSFICFLLQRYMNFSGLGMEFLSCSICICSALQANTKLFGKDFFLLLIYTFKNEFPFFTTLQSGFKIFPILLGIKWFLIVVLIFNFIVFIVYYIIQKNSQVISVQLDKFSKRIVK